MNHLQRIKIDVTEALKYGKQRVYGVVGLVEQKVQHREEIPGDLANLVKNAVNEIKETAVLIDEVVQMKGGYEAVANKVKNKVTATLTNSYKTLEGVFTDKEKAKELLDSSIDLGKMLGTKGIDLVKQAAVGVHSDYRKVVPSAEDLVGKYAGMGTAYEGLPLKPTLDQSLAFHERAKSTLPNGLKLRKEILTDIKASVSVNASELLEFYLPQEKADAKFEAVVKYEL
jgi:hypothetical protein